MNLDFSVDVLDVIVLANIVIEDLAPSNLQMTLSDFNFDNTNDILDLVLLIELILSN